MKIISQFHRTQNGLAAVVFIWAHDSNLWGSVDFDILFLWHLKSCRSLSHVRKHSEESVKNPFFKTISSGKMWCAGTISVLTHCEVTLWREWIGIIYVCVVLSFCYIIMRQVMLVFSDDLLSVFFASDFFLVSLLTWSDSSGTFPK